MEGRTLPIVVQLGERGMPVTIDLTVDLSKSYYHLYGVPPKNELLAMAILCASVGGHVLRNPNLLIAEISISFWGENVNFSYSCTALPSEPTIVEIPTYEEALLWYVVNES